MEKSINKTKTIKKLDEENNEIKKDKTIKKKIIKKKIDLERDTWYV